MVVRKHKGGVYFDVVHALRLVEWKPPATLLQAPAPRLWNVLRPNCPPQTNISHCTLANKCFSYQLGLRLAHILARQRLDWNIVQNN